MFSLFLNEGLIKLPPNLTKQIVEFFVYWYLAYLKSLTIDNPAYDEDDIAVIEDSIKKLAVKYGVSNPTDSQVERVKNSLAKTGVFKNFKIEDLPEHYLARLGKMKGPEAVAKAKDATAKFIIAFGKHRHISGKEFGAFIRDQLQIVISIKNMQTSPETILKWLSSFNTVAASREIDKAIGTLEHEITHLVQELIMIVLHSDQDSVEGKYSGDNKKDSYYTSQTEFDPMVKSSIRAINSLFSKKKAKTVQEKKDILNKFTWGDTQPDKIPNEVAIEDDRSRFFRALRRSDMAKWKRAVKLLAQVL